MRKMLLTVVAGAGFACAFAEVKLAEPQVLVGTVAVNVVDPPFHSVEIITQYIGISVSKV